MIFGCFCFYSSAINPKEDRIQKFLFMMLPFTLNLIRAHTVGNYARLIINISEFNINDELS